MCLLAQSYSYCLPQIVSSTLVATDLLELIRDAVKVVSTLYKKYGPFSLTEGMLGTNKNK